MYLQDSEASIEVHVHTPSAGRPGGIWRGGHYIGVRNVPPPPPPFKCPPGHPALVQDVPSWYRIRNVHTPGLSQVFMQSVGGKQQHWG